MKFLISAACILYVMNIAAQTKVTAISSSVITGISLPAGSKQDKRMLYISGARLLLETVSKKTGTGIKNTEILYLPASYSIDSLEKTLQNANWNISPVEGEPGYLWLQQNSKQVLAYFSTKKKEPELYFGEAEKKTEPSTSTSNHIEPNKTGTEVTQQNTTVSIKPSLPGSGYYFTVTNFDDGWVSTVKEEWVEVTKGTLKVLLHYPNKKADAYNSVLKEEDYTAWNTLVAPRYSNMKNFEWKSIQSWQSISFMEADATETASGKPVHIVLFKKHYSNGNGRYLEFVTVDKAGYENEFGAYHNNELDWDKTANMQYRNKFSIAANDLLGKWTTSDYASISYYYVNSGGLAGTTSTSTADEFTFTAGNNYQSQHSGASGMVGNMKFSNQVYKGKSTVTNWAITLTNRFEGATEKFDCYFEAVKGGRVLLMTDRLNTTHALVKK